MKNYIKYLALSALAFGIFSCDDGGDEQIDGLLDTVETGAILRTVEVLANELPIGAEGSQFSIIVEEQDEQDGGLLQSVDVFATFADNSEEDGDTTGANFSEFAVTTIDASAFMPGPFGLPRAPIVISADELNAGAGVTGDQLFGGDTFSIRLVLNLTDGRSFTSTDVNGNIAGGSFFLSPFAYTATVTCPVPEAFLVGDFLMERTSAGEDPFFPNYGPAIATQLVSISGTGATRTFNFSFFPESFDFGQVMTLQLVCGDILVSGTAEAGTLGCGDGSIGQSNGDIPPSDYLMNGGDDSVVEVAFEDFNPDAGCGTGSYPVTITLTRQ